MNKCMQWKHQSVTGYLQYFSESIHSQILVYPVLYIVNIKVIDGELLYFALVLVSNKNIYIDIKLYFAFPIDRY